VTADPKSARFEKAELSDQRNVPLTLFNEKSFWADDRGCGSFQHPSVRLSRAAKWELRIRSENTLNGERDGIALRALHRSPRSEVDNMDRVPGEARMYERTRV